MIWADEYEELEKEREVFTQENKFSKSKSASPAQEHAEDVKRQQPGDTGKRPMVGT